MTARDDFGILCLMWARVTRYARGLIGTYRQSAVIRRLHSVAAFIESAYENDGTSLEEGERQLIARLRGSDIRSVMDVGAHLGEWSALALRAWPACHVHAIEVAPETCDQLRQRFAENGRLTINQCGLSDHIGTETLYYFPDHPELTCDHRRHPGYVAHPFVASIVTGDAYCDRHGIETIDLLKIDVEGAELRVLRGFERRLHADAIACLTFEYGAFGIDTRTLLRDFYDLLGERYWIGKVYRATVDFRDYDWRHERFAFATFCAVSRHRPDLRQRLTA